MRIVHLSTLHAPHDVRIFEKEARTLAAAGHDVHVIAPGPEGARDGIRIHDLGVSTQPGLRSLIRRLAAGWRAARRLRPDVYHLHEPELIPLGALLSLSRARVVYDAHEDTPRQVRAMHSNHAARGRALSIVWTLAQHVCGATVDGVVAATPSIAERFPIAKTVAVRNFPTASDREGFVGGPHAARPPHVVYLGGISTIRGAREMAAAIERVSAPGARLVLAGAVREVGLETELGRDRIELRELLPRDAVAALLRDARVGLLILHPVQSHVESLPIKLFEYMAAGIPVVASDFPHWRELIDGAGVLVNPLDVAAIAAALDGLIRDPAKGEAMGKRGRELVETRYRWEDEAAKLLALYERLA